MRTTLIIVAIVAAVYAAGWFRTTEVRTEIEIAASPQEVWDVLLNFESYPEWNPFIKNISGTPEAGERLEAFIEPIDWASGMTITPVVLVSDAPNEFRWLGNIVIPGIFDGEHYFLIEAAPGGTRLVHGENFRGVLNLFMDMSQMDKSFDAMNRALKERAEAEPVER